ncbi:hypothetical protein [Aquimarina sp. RZ0]|uniref:hypothetical protein n=1 Tax=Aquimarina sp. RZ0 TaxID=2607730 RepID=UPI0011F16C8F|nr:hypothetical protein [Aquimarina sp. RZ0]KAA1244555.1 hypothetical protein F0000_16345 [Aquimarina sp. RZ0]
MNIYILLFLNLSISFLANSQEKEYYLETIEGEKIRLDEFYTVNINWNNVEYYIYEKERKGLSISPEFFKIKNNKILKIVYGDRLILPFNITNKKNKFKMLEIVLVNSKYTLTREYSPEKQFRTSKRPPPTYYIFDKNKNKLLKGSLETKEKKEVFEALKKYFPTCKKPIASVELFLQLKENYKWNRLLASFRNYDCSVDN